MKSSNYKNLTGLTFDQLRVVEDAGIQIIGGRKRRVWQCHCSCGNDVLTHTSQLTTGKTKSCGCRRVTSLAQTKAKDPYKTKRDLTGQRFSWLMVESRAHEGRSTDGYIHWNCRCYCGNTCIVSSRNLRNGMPKDCGCGLIDNPAMEGQPLMPGMRFGLLELIEVSAKNKSGKVVTATKHWRCQCDCGNDTVVTDQGLRLGRIVSCGCFARKLRSHRVDALELGQKFGKHTLVEKVDDRTWLCRCDCGKEQVKTASQILVSVRRNPQWGCGKCGSANRLVDLTGQRFGSLVAVEIVRRVRRNAIWLCQCDCGKTKEVYAHFLTAKSDRKVVHCGCQRRKPGRKPKT